MDFRYIVCFELDEVQAFPLIADILMDTQIDVTGSAILIEGRLFLFLEGIAVQGGCFYGILQPFRCPAKVSMNSCLNSCSLCRLWLLRSCG